MDYFDSNHMDLSVRDVFESEVQTEMDQILRSGSVSYDPQTETIDLTEYNHNENGDLAGHFSTDSAAMQDIVWLDTIGTLSDSAAVSSAVTCSTGNSNLDLASHLSSPEKFALDSQGILVNPQTGQPVSTLNVVLGLSPQQQQQQNQAILQLQQQAQQLEQGQSLENLASHNLNSQMGFTPAQQQQFLSLTPQQLQQSGLLAGQVNFQTLPVLGLQQQQQQQQNTSSSMTASSHQQQTASSLLSKQQKLEPIVGTEQKVYPKPAYSYSCLITMAMKNSKTGCMPVSDIYQFMCENFPYFKTAPDGWKNSVRHNLSLNKCFAKIEKPATANGSSRKGCLWALNPEKAAKMAEEVHKWTKKDPAGIRRSMAKPEELERIEERVKDNNAQPILNAKTVAPTTTADIKTIVMKAVSTPLSTATTTTTTVPVVNPKSHVMEPIPVSLYQAVDIFNGDINIVDPSLASLDGDFNLPDHLMDPLNCELMNLDVPVTISPLPSSNPLFGGFLDTSPLKDNQSLTTMSETPSQYSQFCSPSRTPVTAFM